MNPGWRVIDCTDFDGTLSYSRGQLEVNSESSLTELPLTQLAVVLIGIHTRISGATLAKLSEYDVAVLVCDWRNVPVAGALPWREHTRIGARHIAQARASQPKQKQAWAALVTAKICGQAHAARAITNAQHKDLDRLALTVRSGDTTNVEARAARLYWSSITDFSFKRLPRMRIDPFNSALDYGYTVLRGIGIRAVTSAGLSSALGVFHRGRNNPFNLVDDLMEPFRPMVDQIVFTQLELEDQLDKAGKHTIVETLTTVPFNAKGQTVSTVFEDLAQTYGQYVEGQLDRFVPQAWEGELSAPKWS